MRRTAKIATGREMELKKAIRDSNQEMALKMNKTALQENETVDIHINTEALYNPLSVPEQRLPDSNLYTYIEEAASLLVYLVPIRVIFHGVPEEERDKVSAMIKAHYDTVLQDQLWEKRSNTIRTIGMLIIGLSFICLLLALSFGREDSLGLKLLSIIGSFALWEAADCFLFARRDIKHKMMKTAQFLTMKIVFE